MTWAMIRAARCSMLAVSTDTMSGAVQTINSQFEFAAAAVLLAPARIVAAPSDASRNVRNMGMRSSFSNCTAGPDRERITLHLRGKRTCRFKQNDEFGRGHQQG